MLATKQIFSYPVPCVLDKKLEDALERFVRTIDKKKAREFSQAIDLYRAFLDIQGIKLRYKDFHQQKKGLYRQFKGFIYKHCALSGTRLSAIYCRFKLIVEAVCEEAVVEAPAFPDSSHKQNSDIKRCIEEYELLKENNQKLAYYFGWYASCKEGEKAFVNLSFFHLHYGDQITKKLWISAKNYCVKTHLITARGNFSEFQTVIKSLILLCPTLVDLQFAGAKANVDRFIIQLFSVLKTQVKIENKSVKNFYKTSWPKQLRMIKLLLIDSGIWSKPAFELFCPKYKSSSIHANTHNQKDERGCAFNDKLVTPIPLSYTDNEAIEAIIVGIDRDIKHVSNACNYQVDLTMSNFALRKKLAREGVVRPFNVHPYDADYVKVDMSILPNKCANWEYYKWNYPGLNYPRFLEEESTSFAHDLGLLTGHTLIPFLYLLVQEHPKITRTWLTDFKLYDKNGKQQGVKQSANVWVARSLKRRKGTIYADQPVILNQKSKKLFDDIIELTSDAREWLKEQGNEDWRFLLLSSQSGFAKPKRLKWLAGFKDLSRQASPLGQKLLQATESVDCIGAQTICDNLNFSSFRASCGVRVYLQTRSVKSMSEALGHENYNPKLLSHYLPDPILKYFEGRWVRIFQNALVYEAMKNSEYLLEAIDIPEKELQEFLNNHKLKPLPEHLSVGQLEDLFKEPSLDLEMKEAVIPLSTDLLRLMNSIVELVDKAPKKQLFTEFAVNWYDTAKFVMENIDSDRCSEDIVAMMTNAKAAPLVLEKIKGAIYVA